MNERPTPETNAARHDLSDYGSPVPCSYGDWVPFEVAEKLERERDEAWACCDELVVDSNAITLAKTVMKLERERDEAIADRDIARLSALESDRAHDRMVAELEKVYKERDVALSQIVQAECRAERFCQERDEAVAECKSLWSLVNANKLRAYKAERELDRLKEALEYIAHAGLSARHIEDYAKEFLRREEDAK